MYIKRMKPIFTICILSITLCAGCGSKFITSAQKGDTAAIKAILAKASNVNESNKYGRTALMEAAANGHSEAIAILLDAGADLHATDNDGRTALMLTAEPGRFETLLQLLANGANANTIDNDDYSALILVAAGAPAEGQTRRSLVVKELLNNGADVNAKTKSGDTALIAAASKGRTDSVKTLLDNGADVNVKNIEGSSALMLAAIEGYTDTVMALLSKGADVNARNNNGQTPLMCAAQRRCDRPSQPINEKLTVKVAAKFDYSFGITRLPLRIKGQTDIDKALLEAGAQVNAKDKFSRTALMYAAAVANSSIVELLLDEDAEVNAKDNDGCTALMLTVRCPYEGRPDTVKTLLSKGADVNIRDNRGRTAFSKIWQTMPFERKQVADLLVQSGAVK